MSSRSVISPAHIGLSAVGAIFAVAMVALVLAPSARPDVPEYVPEVVSVPAGNGLVGPLAYTIDGRSQVRWRFFRFAAGGAVAAGDDAGWDLAVRRHHLIVNGGAGFSGHAGIAIMGQVPFDSVDEAPSDGFLTTRAANDSMIEGFKWYAYGFLSHMLTPRGDVYVVRTADGRYAKFEILSYYCTGAQPGCLTIRYAYQGDGSRRLSPAAAPFVSDP